MGRRRGRIEDRGEGRGRGRGVRKKGMKRFVGNGGNKAEWSGKGRE